MIEDNQTGQNDRPIKDVVIVNCGSILVETPFAVAKEASD